MRRAGQYDELPVRVGQLPEEVEQILLARDPVMFAAHDHHRRLHLPRIDDRQVGGHVEISSGRHLFAEGELGIGQRVGNGGVARSRMVAGEDAADHRAIPEPAIVGAKVVELLGPLG